MDAQTKKDIKIYQAYLYQKRNHSILGGVKALCKDFGVSRGTFYEVVSRVKNGNQSKIKRAMEGARLDVLWTYKYAPRYASLAHDRKPDTIDELREIIKGMDGDKFPQARIAVLLKKDRSTVIHHLNNN